MLAAVTAMTYFPLFDMPVFWPLLLIYFVFAVVTVVLKQSRHMRKYNYGLADFFKKTPGRK